MAGPSRATHEHPSATASPAGVRVLSVERGSLGARVGVRPGDRLLTINRHAITDVVDVWFHSAAERLSIEWLTADDAGDATPRKRTVRKAFHERLGLEVEPFEIRRCTNHCVFCFVHQLPPGMRRELYIKDEDYRLSFLYGNYITGTNLSPDDLKRIVKMKLSPLFFSVHATDQEVRERLLAKQHIEPIMPLMRRLTAKGIVLHAQIVLCPGINDGPVLEETVADLATLHPRLESVAVVPLGMTDHRARLPQLAPVTPEYARAFLPVIEKLQARTKRRVGYPVVFPSDEFFLIAGLQPPSYDRYPEIPQLANGVGMYYRLYREAVDVVADMPVRLPGPRRVAAITTHMGAQVLGRLVEMINARVTNLELRLIPVTNTLFGAGITVTGLLPGRDFERAILANPGFDRYLIPENSLRPWDRRFLDDMTLEQLRSATDAEIVAGGDTASSFAAATLEPVAG